MSHHLAQINIAKFRLPIEHPVNTDFLNDLDRINAIAEQQPAFVWRFVGEGNSAIDVKAFGDPNVAVNMSVWTDMAVPQQRASQDHVAPTRVVRKDQFLPSDVVG